MLNTKTAGSTLGGIEEYSTKLMSKMYGAFVNTESYMKSVILPSDQTLPS
jgi:hypothetical protein